MEIGKGVNFCGWLNLKNDLCILYTVPKNLAEQYMTHMTLHAQSLYNNDHRHITSVLEYAHKEGFVSRKYHRPPSLSLILYLFCLILYDLNLCHTSRRGIVLSFEFSGRCQTHPPWFCVQPVSLPKTRVNIPGYINDIPLLIWYRYMSIKKYRHLFYRKHRFIKYNPGKMAY